MRSLFLCFLKNTCPKTNLTQVYHNLSGADVSLFLKKRNNIVEKHSRIFPRPGDKEVEVASGMVYDQLD